MEPIIYIKKYIKEVEYDIEKHNDYLTKILSYVKTCFIEPISFIGLSIIHISVFSLKFEDIFIDLSSAVVGVVASFILIIIMIIDKIRNSSEI